MIHFCFQIQCFEAWNNLAKCYIKNGQKSRAYYALKEAVKCNYESWMVWDNLMVVSVDCGCFEEVSHLVYVTQIIIIIHTVTRIILVTKGNQMLS